MYLSGDALTLPMPKVRGVVHTQKKEACVTAPFLISYTLYLISKNRSMLNLYILFCMVA